MNSLNVFVAAAVVFGTTFGLRAFGQEALPRPDQPFTGKMEADSRDSVPAWPKPVEAPEGAPNVLLILVDDVGFAATSTFGGPILTPNFTELAKDGLRYNRFHVNSICAASRASLLSGRNDHHIGFGTITEFAAGYPGYNSIWPKNAACVAEVLRDNGYNTAAFGKWHDTPVWEISPAGPFDHWPTGLGFDYFYGFLSAFDNEYYPRLYRDTIPVEPAKTPEEGYYLTTDLTNDAIRWLHLHDAAAPNKPFFIYFAPGATHTPDQVPKEWIAPYRGKFDQGWDKLREEIFARQKQLGVIPATAQLTSRPEGLPAWDSLPPKERKLLAHEAEVYAAYGTEVDHEIGRLIQAVRQEGQGQNTLVIEIFGDNGGSAEDGPTGYDARTVDGKNRSIDQRLQTMDGLGSEIYMNAAAAAWAWAYSTPFQGTKTDASHLGGTRDPMVISWPSRIHEDGGLRTQFSHLTDIVPTIYAAAGITPPTTVDGIKQMPFDGVSLLYTFENPNAPSRHHIQVFETQGNRAIYQDGWWAGQLLRPSWHRIGAPGYTDQILLNGNIHPWELYNLNDDFSQAHDLASKYPQKLAEMKKLFDQEARENNIYPILPLRQPYPMRADRQKYVYREGVDRLQNNANIRLGGGEPYTITAEVEVPAQGAAGVIFAQGGRYGGDSLFVKNGHVIYDVNAFGNDAGKLISSGALKPGKNTIELHVVPEDEGAKGAGASLKRGRAHPAIGSMTINGVPAGEAKFVNVPATGGYWSGAETLDIGSDQGSAVSADYKGPDRFTGSIDKVVVELK